MAKLNVLFIANCFVLGYIGQSPLEAPFLFLGQLSTALYFLYFALCPVINYLDTLFVRAIIPSNTLVQRGLPFLLFALLFFVENLHPLMDNIFYVAFFPFFNLNKHRIIPLFIIIVIYLVTVIKQHSFFLLLLMILLSLLPTLYIFKDFMRPLIDIEVLMERIIVIFNKLKLLNLLNDIYITLNDVISVKIFQFYAFVLYLGIIIHIVTIRYIFYLKLNHLDIPLSLTILYYIGFTFVIIRLLHQLSYFFIPYLLRTNKYNSIFLIGETPDEEPVSPQNGYQDPNKKYYFLVDINIITIIHRYHLSIQN